MFLGRELHGRSATMLGFGDRGGSLHWQADGEACASGDRLHLYRPSEFLGDDSMDDLESKTCARSLGLGGKKGLKDVGERFRGDTGAVIDDADGQVGGFGTRPRLRPCGDFYATLVG